MKPRTKLQKRVMDALKRCPLLTFERRTKVFEAVVPKTAKYTKTAKTMTCMVCGHSWKAEKSDAVVCPHCGRELTVDHSAKRNLKEECYVSFSDAVEGFQVVTMMVAQVVQRKGEATKFFMDVAYQRWISEDGSYTIVARTRCSNYWYLRWNWNSDLEIRNEPYYNNPYWIFPYKVFNADSVTERLRRNGFDGDFHDNNPHVILSKLLTSSKHETLWKGGYYGLAQLGSQELEWLWPSIKIAIRNKYLMETPTSDGEFTLVKDWRDYIRNLIELGLDIRSPKYVCPQDLKQAHEWSQKQVNAKRAKEKHKQELERQRLEAERMEKSKVEFQERMSKFFKLCFTDGDLIVRPLTSIQEFFEEGKAMRHCVYTNKYYDQPDSLIMSATINGERAATIEFSLKDMRILQCRGKCNSVPEAKDRINNLIMSNVRQIAKAN